MTDATLELAKALIARPSVTPADAGCQDLLAQRLAPLGFHIERLRFGEVDNLWARLGTSAPLVVLAGHSDVVPPGDLNAWRTDPFVPHVRDGRLYGRGAADMKSSLAAFVTAGEALVKRPGDMKGSLAYLVTSDEEGDALDGTRRVVEHLVTQGVHIDQCIVGEPTAERESGDVIKNGRRGSLGARLLVRGKQGHVAYPQMANNPIHRSAGALAELVNTEWDRGNAHFPPTTLQVSNISAGTGATNVIPGTLEVLFNFRFSTAVTESALQERVREILDRNGVDYDIHWTLSGHPYLTPEGRLIDVARRAIRRTVGIDARLSTDGGTSDGRFIAPTGAEVVEIGPPNATIHQVDESIDIAEPRRLHAIYLAILEDLLAGGR